MKKLIFLLLLSFSCGYSQQLDSNWAVITSNVVYDMVDDGENIWVAGFGLKVINKETDEVTYINKFNSDFPTDYAYSIAIDSSGNKIIGVKNGILKYDNISFIYYEKCFLEDTLNIDWLVREIIVSHDNTLWLRTLPSGVFGVSKGLIHCDLELSSSKIKFKGNIWSIKYHDSIIYFGNHYGLYYVQNDSIGRINFSEYVQTYGSTVYDIEVDSYDNLWVGFHSGILRITPNFDYKFFGRESVFEIRIDKEDNIFILNTYGNSLYSFSNYDFKELKSKIMGSHIDAIFFSNDNILYIKSEKGITTLMDSHFNTISTDYSFLPHRTVNSIKNNPENELIIGSAGIAEYRNNRQIQMFGYKKFLASDFDFNDDYIFAGTDGDGLFIYDKNIKRWDRLWETFLLPSDRIFSIHKDKKDRIWIGGLGGFVSFYGKYFDLEIIKTTFNSGIIYAIVEGNHNTIWFGGTRHGLVSFDYNVWENYYPPNINIDSFRIKCLDIDYNNEVWLGTEFNGIWKFSEGFWEELENDEFDEESRSISAIESDKYNNLWVGYENSGLSKFNGQEWKNISQSNSYLNEMTINDIFIDSLNNKWLATDEGIFIYNEEHLTLSSIQESLFTPKQKSLLISPNPATDYIEIYFSGNRENPMVHGFEIEIFDVLGKSVLRNTPSSLRDATPLLEGNNRINISNLQPGIYFVRVESGGFVETQKFVKL